MVRYFLFHLEREREFQTKESVHEWLNRNMKEPEHPAFEFFHDSPRGTSGDKIIFTYSQEGDDYSLILGEATIQDPPSNNLRKKIKTHDTREIKDYRYLYKIREGSIEIYDPPVSLSPNLIRQLPSLDRKMEENRWKKVGAITRFGKEIKKEEYLIIQKYREG
jgi:hypothetical protein